MAASYMDSSGEFREDEEDDVDDVTLIKARSEASSPWGHERYSGSSDSESTEDSDAEFAVHPILRSLIKSKSAYTIKKGTTLMKASKTTFELSLSKMLSSTTHSVLAEKEPAIALFDRSVDEKWPEPEEERGKHREREPSLSKMSGCWSSPPNVFLDETACPSSPESVDRRDGCWSAPECGDSMDDSMGAAEAVNALSAESAALARSIHFSQSYPAILTPEPALSQCSIQLVSSSGTSAESPSPPRPLSPVLGKPGMASSRSMVMRPRPSIGHLTRNSTPSEDEWREPWPHQEVWPEEGVMYQSLRNGWTETNLNPIPRSTSVQFAPVYRDGMRTSNTHCGLATLGEFVGRPETSSSFQYDASQRSQAGSSTHLRCDSPPMEESSHSGHSQLDEMESFELARRSAWLERGSLVQLSSTQGGESDWYRPQDRDPIGMRRSATTAEFRKGRRRLPRLPDEASHRADMPSSVSMYDRGFFEYAGSHHYSDYGDVHEEECRTQALVPPGQPERIDAGPPTSLQLQTTAKRRDDIACIPTPISPMQVLPSPQSSGRRLPPLPVHPSLPLGALSTFQRIPAMTQPPKNEHTLCYIEGMSDSVMARSGMEDSYYEDDGINGNAFRVKGKSFFSAGDSSGVSSCTNSDSLNPTHRSQFAFIPRHSDEVLLEIGDAVHVDRTCEDHWCYGTNMRTGQSGIFPSAVVCEIDLVEEICLGSLPTNTAKVMTNDRDTFYLTMLASIEVAHHKGNDILIQAMNKVMGLYKNREEIIVPQTVLMEISFRGIHVIDKRKKNFFQCPTFDFFYSLQNISFCGAHPKQLKYFGFITKHPLLPRFACHVFMSNASTQPIVEAIGRAFKRSYDEYMAFAHPTEDIYLE